MTKPQVKIPGLNFGSGKLPIFDEEDYRKPPAYSEVEPRKEEPLDLISAIRVCTK